MKSVNVVIVDPNDITRKGLEAVLSEIGGRVKVSAAFALLSDAENYLQHHLVNVLALDDLCIAPPEVVRTVNRYCETSPNLSLIILSQRRDGAYIREVMACGNAGFLLKEGDIQQPLLAAIRLASDNYVFLSAEAARLMGNRPNPQIARRDLEVLRLLEQELNIKEIGARLKVSTKTIYRTRDKLKRTLGVRNNESLLDAARRQGLLDQKLDDEISR